jgi:uncharacterized protein (TIGR03437 family)
MRDGSAKYCCQSGAYRRLHIGVCDRRRSDGPCRSGRQCGRIDRYLPVLPVSATIGGIPALVQSSSGAQGQVAGVIQVTLQVPAGVQPGGYVPVVVQVGNVSSTDSAAWIAVSGN